ncbi:MAG: acyl-CoA dehydrogenase family protein [Acidimicrobiia bacterium]
MEVEEFRAKAKAWLAENASKYPADPNDIRARELRVALWDAGLLGITLDPAYGGQGLSNDHQNAFNEEARAAGVAIPSDSVTVGICAPTLLDFGDKEQITRHVPAMIKGEEVWTQLLSEPGAGSDLAGLQTKAVLDGEEWVITGQKVWTSGAMQSDYALCIARSNPDVPKHAGLSMFIVPLRDHAGVTIRPLKQMNGEAHFNEVFLDEVRVPAANLVGAENQGWKALTAMLTHERLALGAGTGAGGGSGQSWAGSNADRFIAMARARGLNEDAEVRQELVEIYILERTLALMGQKMRDEIAAGINVGSKGSVAKLATAILSKRSASLGMALGGAAAQAWDPADPKGGELTQALLFSPMTAIAGGTSEIQRNTIGERVLGLPREPSVDREIPFKDILQNATR